MSETINVGVRSAIGEKGKKKCKNVFYFFIFIFFFKKKKKKEKAGAGAGKAQSLFCRGCDLMED